MARDYIDIGSAPAEEDCAQVGDEGYETRARPECNRYIALLRKTFGPEPEGASLRVKSNSHDFGTYLSVVCNFDDTNQLAIDYAYKCEGEAPATWGDPDANDQPAATPVDRVCDSCLACAEEQGIPDVESQAMLMMELGSDVEDHLCDQVEDPRLGFQCRCGCRRGLR